MGLRVILWEQQPRKDKTCCIKIYLHRDKHKYYGLDIYCLPAQFNHKVGRVKRSRTNCYEINSKISAAYSKFENLMLNFPSAGVDRIVEMYDQEEGHSTEDLLPFIENFIAECKAGKFKRSISIIKQYQTCLNQLREFKDDLNFTDIGKDFYDSFLAHLRKPFPGRNLNDNTIGARIKCLKTFLNEAKENNIYKGDEHRKKYFKTLQTETDAIFLTQNEIQQIENKILPSHLAIERDRFLVAYYLLLRYSDSIRIHKAMIFKQDKTMFIRIRSKKTNQEVVIPIKPIVKTILERNNYSLKYDTNQEANWKLKEIGKLAGIKEKVFINNESGPKYNYISTHTARRSGATNLYLTGMPEIDIMMIGGWKDRDMFRKYIRVTTLETAQRVSDHPFFK